MWFSLQCLTAQIQYTRYMCRKTGEARIKSQHRVMIFTSMKYDESVERLFCLSHIPYGQHRKLPQR